MEFSDLLVILGGFQNIFNFCVSQKFLASCQQCSRCGCNMELTETTRVKDGYMWRCTNKRCRTWLSRRCCSSVFPTELERPLFIVSSQHISNLELSSTQINSLRTYHSTSWDISMYQSIIPKTLLTPTVVHTPIPSKASGPWSRKS